MRSKAEELYFHLSISLKWSLKYLSDYWGKRDFSWLSELGKGSEKSRYTKEEVVGYRSKYDGLRAHRVCINYQKDGFSNHHHHGKNNHFFKNIFLLWVIFDLKSFESSNYISFRSKHVMRTVDTVLKSSDIILYDPDTY